MKKYIVPASVFVVVLVLFNIFIALLLVSSLPVIYSYLKKRKDKLTSLLINKQFIESLKLIVSSLRSGQTLLMAFEDAAVRVEKPIADYYSEVLTNHRIGKSLEASLIAVAGPYNNNDMELFGIIVSILKESGGNTVLLLSNMIDASEQKQKLKGKIEAMTAQGRLSGLVVGVLPVALLLMFWFLDKSLISPLFNTLEGFLLLFLAAVLEVAGLYLIARITEVEL